MLIRKTKIMKQKKITVTYIDTQPEVVSFRLAYEEIPIQL